MEQKEYVEKIEGIDFVNWNRNLHMKEAKQCALICVDEIIKELATCEISTWIFMEKSSEWQDVKKEIEML